MLQSGKRRAPGSANPWAIELTPPWPPTWAPVQLGWAAAICAGAASRTGARSTALCRIGLAAAGASSAMAGTANIAAPKTAATEKRFLFIRPALLKNSAKNDRPVHSKKDENRRFPMIFLKCCRFGADPWDGSMAFWYVANLNIIALLCRGPDVPLALQLAAMQLDGKRDFPT
jgi:hypothetical protein